MKITKYLLQFAALASMAIACQPELEKVQFDVSTGTIPVLNAVEDIIVTDKNLSTDMTEFSWSKVEFEQNVEVLYSIEASAEGFNTIELATDIVDTEVELTYSALNNLFYNTMLLSNLQTYDVNFVVCAYVGESAKLKSEPVTAKVKVVASEKQYPKYFVVGSYNSWSHGNAQQEYLFDFAEDGARYSGVVDFGENHSSNEFKLTKGDWGNGEHSASGEQESEAETIQLVAGGGDNIKAYNHDRYYHFTFDVAGLSLTKNYSFNELKIEGSAVPGGSLALEFKISNQKFWVDAELNDGSMKFVTDKSADNLVGSEDIAVTAGKYRVYLNLNNPSDIKYELSTRDYGAVEGTEPEPEPEPEEPAPAEGTPVKIFCEATGWAVTNLYGWGGKLSFSWPGIPAEGTATIGGKEYSYWTLAAENYGATEVGLIFNNGSLQTVDIKPVTLDGNKYFKVGEAGGDGKLGYEELATPALKITYKNEAGWDAVSMYGWGDLGDFGGWPGSPMTKEGDVWVYEISCEHFGKSTNLIFNNAGAGAQTVDLGPFVLEGDLEFDNSNAAIK